MHNVTRTDKLQGIPQLCTTAYGLERQKPSRSREDRSRGRKQVNTPNPERISPPNEKVTGAWKKFYIGDFLPPVTNR